MNYAQRIEAAQLAALEALSGIRKPLVQEVLTLPLTGLTPPTGAEAATQVTLRPMGGSVWYRELAPTATATNSGDLPEGAEFTVFESEFATFSAIVNTGTPRLWAVWA